MTKAAPPPLAIELPEPKHDDLSLTRALLQRRTTRKISDKPLPWPLISELLWAAWGINRQKGPYDATGRTAASASNSQEIDLYVALEPGVYLYNAHKHRLDLAVSGDQRRLGLSPGQRETASLAALQLFYVADLDRLVNTQGFKEPGLKDPDVQKSYYFVDTGMIAANVYLFAAAQGLGCWFHNCDRDSLMRMLGLRRYQRVLFAQSVGYPLR